jgi:hypothetical protein
MPFLDDLVQQGKPLAEVVIRLQPGSPKPEIVAALNQLGPDLQAYDSPSTEFVPAGGHPNPELMEIQATKEALLRVFGWELVRENLPRWYPDRQVYDGVWPDAFCWKELNEPARFPAPLEGCVAAIGLSQPGSADNGQADTVTYALPGQD